MSTTNPRQFVVYRDQAGEWRWKLFAENSKIIADSSEGYRNKADAIIGARLVSSISSGAQIWNYDDQRWES